MLKFEMDNSYDVNSCQEVDNTLAFMDEDSCDSGFDSNESETEASPLSRSLRLKGERQRTEEGGDIMTRRWNQQDSEESTHAFLNSSLSVEEILDKVEEESHLIGDGSRVHSLPTVRGRHKDLVSVTSSTIRQLLDGHYDDVIPEFQIIDCRYPYEYEGGHIEGAVNLHSKQMINDFISARQKSKSTGRNVLIVHCEFSIERGPTLLRHLRSMDRKMNSDRYPFLFYPAVYLLDGGYKAFFAQNKVHCQPQSYLPMVHENFSQQLRHFRVKSKSWSAGEKQSLRSRRQQNELFPKKLVL